MPSDWFTPLPTTLHKHLPCASTEGLLGVVTYHLFLIPFHFPWLCKHQEGCVRLSHATNRLLVPSFCQVPSFSRFGIQYSLGFAVCYSAYFVKTDSNNSQHCPTNAFVLNSSSEPLVPSPLMSGPFRSTVPISPPPPAQPGLWPGYSAPRDAPTLFEEGMAALQEAHKEAQARTVMCRKRTSRQYQSSNTRFRHHFIFSVLSVVGFFSGPKFSSEGFLP